MNYKLARVGVNVGAYGVFPNDERIVERRRVGNYTEYLLCICIGIVTVFPVDLFDENGINALGNIAFAAGHSYLIHKVPATVRILRTGEPVPCPYRSQRNGGTASVFNVVDMCRNFVIERCAVIDEV